MEHYRCRTWVGLATRNAVDGNTRLQLPLTSFRLQDVFAEHWDELKDGSLAIMTSVLKSDTNRPRYSEGMAGRPKRLKVTIGKRTPKAAAAKADGADEVQENKIPDLSKANVDAVLGKVESLLNKMKGGNNDVECDGVGLEDLDSIDLPEENDDDDDEIADEAELLSKEDIELKKGLDDIELKVFKAVVKTKVAPPDAIAKNAESLIGECDPGNAHNVDRIEMDAVLNAVDAMGVVEPEAAPDVLEHVDEVFAKWARDTKTGIEILQMREHDIHNLSVGNSGNLSLIQRTNAKRDTEVGFVNWQFADIRLGRFVDIDKSDGR